MAERAVDLDGHPGLLVRPRNATALYVLAHGAGAGMRHEFMQSIADALADHAIATLRYEFPFMAAGKARPDSPAIAEATVRTVWNASAKLARGPRGRSTPELPRFCGGKSFGGRMTSRAHAAQPLADLRGLIFLGFPLHPPDKPGIERAEHLMAASGPMLFLQGTRDDLADLALLRPVIASLDARSAALPRATRGARSTTPPRATLHIVEHADHGFDVLVRSGRTRDEVLDELAGTIASWIASH